MRKKHTKTVVDLTLDYYKKLTDRNEYLWGLLNYHQSQITGSDGEYDRVCKESVEWLSNELKVIGLIITSTTNIIKNNPKNQ